MIVMVQSGMAVVKGIRSVAVARSITTPKAVMFIQLLRRLKEKDEMRGKSKKISIIIRVINWKSSRLTKTTSPSNITSKTKKLI